MALVQIADDYFSKPEKSLGITKENSVIDDNLHFDINFNLSDIKSYYGIKIFVFEGFSVIKCFLI